MEKGTIEQLKTMTVGEIKELTQQYNQNKEWFEDQIKQKEEFVKSLEEKELEDIING